MFSAKFLRVDVFLFLLSLGIFLVWPELDYAVSAVAFDPQTGFVFSELLFVKFLYELFAVCLLYTSPSPRDDGVSRMPSSA